MSEENTTPSTPVGDPTLQMRYNQKSYMKCLFSDPQPKFHLIGEGFTNFAESKNPKEYTRHYIHEESERTDVINYSPSRAYSCDIVSGDPVVDEIVHITDKELKGKDTHREVVTYNEFGGTPTARPATMRKYAIIPDGGADGTEALIYTGNFKAVSDKIEGTWNESTKEFTADSKPSE